MADSNNQGNSTIESDLNKSERSALIAFKKALNERLPEILPETTSISLKIDGNPLDGTLIYLLNNYVLNEKLITEKPELAELRDLYNTLPPDIRAKTETFKTFFVKPTNSEDLRNQEQAVVTLAQRYLGTYDSSATLLDDGNIKIDQHTSRALRNRLKELQSSGEIETDLDPRVFDQRSVNALDELVKKSLQDANVTYSALDGILVNLWVPNNSRVLGSNNNSSPPSREEIALGEAISLRNIMNFMVNAKLPSGASTSKPDTDINWDTQWSNNDSGDRFFSSYVYKSLYNTRTVTTDLLYDKTGYSDENYDILIQAINKLDVDMSKGRIMSQMEAGEIATEILSIKAHDAWCMISPGTEFDEKQIHEMIHAGQFMPHIDDLALAEEGFGLPRTEFFKQKLAEYGPKEAWRLAFEERTATLSFRAEKFTERFGEMPQSAVEEKARIHSTSQEHIRHSYGTPALYFGTARSLFGSTKQTRYEHDRDTYLEKYQKFKEDVGTCDPPPTATREHEGTSEGCTVEGVLRGDTPNHSDDCTVEGVLRGDDFSKSSNPDETTGNRIGSNAEDVTGREQGNCSVECEIDRRMNNQTKIKPN